MSTSLFRTGREGLLALLRAINVRPGDEIIIQGYTCVVLPNAIHAAGGTPIYADIDPETLNLTSETIEPLLSPRTKAIICQHTFGIPSPLSALRKFCDTRGIFLIEDCAHTFPDAIETGEIGACGDAVIVSFGRDKGISGISGGAVFTRKEDIGSVVRELEHSALCMRWIDVLALLTYPLRMMWITRPLHGRACNRSIHWILGKIGLIPRITSKDEKHGRMSPKIGRAHV